MRLTVDQLQSSARSFTLTEKDEKQIDCMRSIVYLRRSSTDQYTGYSRSSKKAEDQYGKIQYITRPPMTAYREDLQCQLIEITSTLEGKKFKYIEDLNKN
jgi:hypothetical protein